MYKALLKHRALYRFALTCLKRNRNPKTLLGGNSIKLNSKTENKEDILACLNSLQITNAFTWGYTNEGSKYWNEIYHTFVKLNEEYVKLKNYNRR